MIPSWRLMQMKNTGKFKVGTKFTGNINNAKMEILETREKQLMTESGNMRATNSIAIIKDLKTGRIFRYGLQALEHCSVTITES